MDYMARIMKAISDGAVPKGGVLMPQIAHQRKCKWEKGRCTCIPDISIETEDGYIELDKNGNIQKKI